eukprot:7779030-Pyramimonas_sp.AAC.1
MQSKDKTTLGSQPDYNRNTLQKQWEHNRDTPEARKEYDRNPMGIKRKAIGIHKEYKRKTT